MVIAGKFSVSGCLLLVFLHISIPSLCAFRYHRCQLPNRWLGDATTIPPRKLATVGILKTSPFACPSMLINCQKREPLRLWTQTLFSDKSVEGKVARPTSQVKSRKWQLAALTQNGDATWDDGGDEVEDDRKVVILRDVAMDRVIECFVDREIEIEGRKYATLMPADTPVILAQVNKPFTSRIPL